MQTRIRPIYLALLFIVTFWVYAAPGRDSGTGDTIPAQLLPLSLLIEGNFDYNEFVCPIDTVTGEPTAYSAERCTAPLPYYLDDLDGRVVSHYPVVPGLLNVPVNAVAMALGIDIVRRRGEMGIMTAALIGAASVVLMALLLGELTRTRAAVMLGTILFASGTLVWSVTSHGLWQHGASLLFMNGALLLLAKRESRPVPWAGLLLGLAVWNRPTNILIALPFVLYVWWHHRERFARFCMMAAIPAVLMVAYSGLVLGSITALGQGQSMRFSATPWVGFAGLMASPARGLLVFTPAFLVGLLYVPRALSPDDRDPVVKYLLAGTVALIALYSFWPVWWGGVSFGYRLLAETIPLFTILFALAWENVVARRKWLAAIAVLLLAASVYVHGLGALVAPCGFDTTPNHIDLDPGRLWDVRDTEILRCARGE